MSLFDDFTAASKSVQNTVYGSGVRVYPTLAHANPNSRSRSVDPDRPEFETTARFYQPVDKYNAPPARNIVPGGMGNTALRSRYEITATIDSPPYEIRSKDRLMRLSDGAWFEVSAAPEPDGTGSFKLTLATAAPMNMDG